MKSKVLGLLAVGLLVGTTSAIAATVTYDFTWSGGAGYSMDGHFSYDDANAADGAIRDSEVASLFFEGFHNGVSIGSNSLAPSQGSFNFNFDTTLGQFFLGGNLDTENGQEWNYHAGGLGFGAGSGASTLTLGAIQTGYTNVLPIPLNATLRSSVPEPASLALLGLGLAGLGLSRRRKAD